MFQTTNRYNIQWIGLREILQDNPIFHGKIAGFRLRFSLKRIHSNMVNDSKYVLTHNGQVVGSHRGMVVCKPQ